MDIRLDADHGYIGKFFVFFFFPQNFEYALYAQLDWQMVFGKGNCSEGNKKIFVYSLTAKQSEKVLRPNFKFSGSDRPLIPCWGSLCFQFASWKASLRFRGHSPDNSTLLSSAFPLIAIVFPCSVACEGP